MNNALVGYIAGAIFGVGLWFVIEDSGPRHVPFHYMSVAGIVAMVCLIVGGAFLGALLGRASE